ncbi:hypothetical protein BZA70DRAFT_275001 [Myxozyma melibiosi]|uniref:Uncharacterized protein n=1 Tax=Myxozyma melibiosi TaxID=54550 RepID=A0ABR1FA76_9ASCO
MASVCTLRVRQIPSQAQISLRRHVSSVRLRPSQLVRAWLPPHTSLISESAGLLTERRLINSQNVYSGSRSLRHFSILSYRASEQLPPRRFSGDERFTEEDLKEAILSSHTLHGKSFLSKWLSTLLIAGTSVVVAGYFTYRIHYRDQAVFLPLWAKPYVFEEVLSPEQIQTLRNLTEDALLGALAYKESVGAMLGLPIIIEKMEDVKFSFPPDRPKEHVIVGVEFYREKSDQIFPRIRSSVRILSIEDAYSRLVTPFANAVGLDGGSDNEREPTSAVHELLDGLEKWKNRVWVDVNGTAVVHGSFVRNQNKSDGEEDSQKHYCVVKFKGFLDLERMNVVTIQSGELIAYEDGKESRRLEW